MKQFTITPTSIIRKEIDGQHHYFVGSRHYSSVTRILDVGAPKPYALLDWFKRNTPEDIERIKEETGEFGSRCHSYFERLLLGEVVKTEDLSPKVTKTLLSFERLFKILKPTKYLAEHVVVYDEAVENSFVDDDGNLIGEDPQVCWAGTLDFLGTIPASALRSFKFPLPEGKEELTVLIDFKTTSAIHETHKMQVCAYASAVEQMYKKKVDLCLIARLGTKHKAGYELAYVDRNHSGQMWDHTFAMFKLMNGNKLPEPPEIDSVPEEIRLIEEQDVRN